MSSKAVSGGELEQSEFNFVGIHSLADYLFTADKYHHNRFCSAKKKGTCPCEAQTNDLDVISTHAISIPKKKGKLSL